MILSAHQPNFLPHLGFFYKMYMSDVFAISDDVQYSKRGFQNYNFVCENGERKKITVPVSFNTGDAIKDIKLSDWSYYKTKLNKRLKSDYFRSPHFRTLYPLFEAIFDKDYNSLCELNVALIEVFVQIFGIQCEIIFESSLGITGDTPTDQIVDLCKKTGCKTYLSGTGAIDYLDTQCLEKNDIELLWSGYEPVNYSSVPNVSALDYVMKCGNLIPKSWEDERKKLRNGKDI